MLIAVNLQVQKEMARSGCQAGARPRIAMPNHNPPLVSHAPPVRLSRTERRFFSDLVQVVCLSTVAVCREIGASPKIGNTEIKRRLTFIAARLKASEREMFEQAVERFTLDAILDYLSEGADERDGVDVDAEIPTAHAYRRNGFVMAQCPYCDRVHQHGRISRTGGAKSAPCARGNYRLEIAGEAAESGEAA
jgi:hypothetical protein